MDATTVIVSLCIALAIFFVIIYLVFGRSEGGFVFDIGGAAPRASGGGDNSPEKTFSSRIIGLGVAVVAVFTTLFAKLWSMQLVSADEYSKMAERNRTRTVSIEAPRGRILDRNGEELVTNRSSLTLVSQADVVSDEVEVQLLANLLAMPKAAVRRKIRDESQGAQRMRVVAVDVPRRSVAIIGAHPEVFPGVKVEERSQRSYPHGSLAAHVLGYTGTVTQEQLDAETTDEQLSYELGDIVGQAGLERQYESVLQGIRGEQSVYVDAVGSVVNYSTSVEPQSGSDVVTTLDIKVQEAAEKSLEKVVAQQRSLGFNCTGGSAVAIDCTTGEVIAMASYPSFDPSLFVGGISTADWENLQSDDAHHPLMNRAISGQYPSGSVIKALSTLAALEKNIITPDSSWYCTGWWTGFGEEYGQKCWAVNGHGAVNVVSGITFSCDVMFYEIGKSFYLSDEPEGMQEIFRRYGLGSQTGVDLPSEVSGRVPDAEWKWNYWSDSPDDARRWQGGDSTNLAIGQGDLLVSCMQMVNAYAGIANKGTIMRPHLLKSVLASDGQSNVIEYKPEVMLTPEQKSDDRDLVCRGLYGVVYEEYQWQASHWNNLSITVNGKTGTAEQYNNDNMGWFIGFGPAEDPKYVVGANIDGAYGGSASAMLVVRDIFGALYDEPDTSTQMYYSTE